MKISLKWVSRLVIFYIVLAFGWWALHQLNEGRRLFEVELALLESKYKGRGVNLTQLQESAEYQKIERYWHKQQRMVWTEGLVMTLCLAFGLWMINRAANREVMLARQSRNFMLSITHELKSPISALRLTLETLGRRELQREQIEKLCQNGLRDATRLQHLVEDLLLAARLEDNWRPLVEPVDISPIVHDCVANLQTRFPAADIRSVIPDNFPLIQADKSGLTAVIQNLLENAVKYSPAGAPVEFRAAKSNGKVHITVADRGIGIPNGEKEAVFEKFYRIGNEEVRNATGTGLGLYIVRQVVRAHGGRIWVTDNQPNGTVFTVEL
ncbi:MAG TPA: HAMP domain-containing sensor histidine kinase [Saprospiraceae bacterium]|nr:HAMP domain-containing sensor histidine kinase [Saprospiraceae bacterium]